MVMDIGNVNVFGLGGIDLQSKYRDLPQPKHSQTWCGEHVRHDAAAHVTYMK